MNSCSTHTHTHTDVDNHGKRSVDDGRRCTKGAPRCRVAKKRAPCTLTAAHVHKLETDIYVGGFAGYRPPTTNVAATGAQMILLCIAAAARACDSSGYRALVPLISSYLTASRAIRPRSAPKREKERERAAAR